jgi:hypothetical protein
LCILNGCISEERILDYATANRDRLPVISIYRDSRLEWTASWIFGELELILAVWADGTIVWSQNSAKGGDPYLEGKCSIDDLSSLLSKAKKKDSGFADRAYLVDDSGYTVIQILDGTYVTRLVVWREFVGPGSGVSSDGREQSEFLELWKLVRQGTMELIPRTGTVLDKGKLRWCLLDPAVEAEGGMPGVWDVPMLSDTPGEVCH